MPLQVDCGEIPCDVACHAYYDVVGDVVTLAYNTLCQLLPEEACAGLDGFVTVGEPSFPLGNYIAGWWVGAVPYNPQNSRAAATQMMPRKLATVGLKLLESGWPQISMPQTNDLPSPEAMSGAALVSMEHYEAVERALTHAVAHRAVGEASGCMFQGLQRSDFIQPSAGLTGWRWSVLLEV